jgi:carboxymethylenebutenolidase
MRTKLTIAVLAIAVVALTATLVIVQAGGQGAAPARNPNLPPDFDAATAQLKSSPRHQEWVDIKVPGQPAPIKTFVVHPERKDKAPVVIVIHEIWGLTEWVKGVADQFAKEGFIAVAPDLLSGRGPNGGNADSFPGYPSSGEAMKAIQGVTNDIRLAVLNEVRNYALKIPSANGRVGVTGYCWGGETTFLFAINQPALDAAVPFYGPMPTDAAAYAKAAKTPLLIVLAENDARVNKTLPMAETELKRANQPFTVATYAGAGHGFLRQQINPKDPTGANMKATEQAWPRTLAFLRERLK